MARFQHRAAVGLHGHVATSPLAAGRVAFATLLTNLNTGVDQAPFDLAPVRGGALLGGLLLEPVANATGTLAFKLWGLTRGYSSKSEGEGSESRGIGQDADLVLIASGNVVVSGSPTGFATNTMPQIAKAARSWDNAYQGNSISDFAVGTQFGEECAANQVNPPVVVGTIKIQIPDVIRFSDVLFEGPASLAWMVSRYG